MLFDTNKSLKLFLSCICIHLIPGDALAAEPGIECKLSLGSTGSINEQRIELVLTLVNKTGETILLPWPEDTMILLRSGVLAITITNQAGEPYAPVPDPGPVYVRRKHHYGTLDPYGTVKTKINLCHFKGGNDHHSLCDRTGRYSVLVNYSNHDNSYLDSGTNAWSVVGNTWVGSAQCNRINFLVPG